MPSRSGVAATGLLLLTIVIAIPTQCLGADGAFAEPNPMPWERGPLAPPQSGPAGLRGRSPDTHIPYNQRLFQRSPASVPGDERWWDGFDLPSVDGFVSCVVEYQGLVIVGGNFRRVGGVSVNNIASWDGTRWDPMGTGADAPVTALSVFQGNLVAAGPFHSVDGVPGTGIARWDGHTWFAMGFGLETEGGNPSYTPALTQYGDDLIAGGWFSNSGGVPVNHVARWDGSSWNAMGAGFDNAVTALVVNADTLYAGGQFLASGGSPDSLVARWNGASWEAVGSGFGQLTDYGEVGQVNAMSSYRGHLVVAGYLQLNGDSIP